MPATIKRFVAACPLLIVGASATFFRMLFGFCWPLSFKIGI